mmetsp:Transcript_12173/g.21685  ORF Transcript_12173/g.21685 Transcript_12173/m.21685 type:complete len:615 (+) Transcript_12173:81-1925(+)
MSHNYGSIEGSIEGSTDEAATNSTAASSSAQQLPVNHLSTYTAGEDAGRLATLAKEFGLSRTRAPKSQVRARVTDSLATLNLESLKLWAGRMISLDKSYLEMRYRSLFSAHLDAEHLAESSVSDTAAMMLMGRSGVDPWGRLPILSEGDLSEEAEEQQNLQIEQEQQQQQPSDPHAAGLGGTLSSATLGIIKGMVGPAILYLPHGFAQAGYLVAIPVLMLSTMLFLWSSKCLLDSWKVESDRVNRNRTSMNKNHMGLKLKKRIILSYPELAYRAFGSSGEKLVQVGILLMQSGVCLTYLIFVPQNLSAAALLLFNWDVSTNWTLALMMAVQIPMSWIRDIRRLTVTNLLANLLILYGLITCLGFAMDDMGDDIDETSSSFLQEVFHRAQSLPAFNPSGWFLFLGTSVLLFEGSITLLVPLQEAVHTSSDRDKFPNLYFKVILGIVSFYSFFGITCWMAFGDQVRTVMTTSLPTGKLATTVQLAYSLAVVFTFPLQNFPSLEIVCVTVERMLLSSGHGKVGSHGSSTTQRNVISTLLVISLSIIAVLTMNDLDKVVSLMGSLLGCPLAFVIPPLIQNQLAKGQIGEWKRRVNIMVAVLGVGAMVVSSVTTLLKWD